MKSFGREAFEERIRQAENSFFFEIRMLQEQFDMSDPEAKTKFHREIASRLCRFTEELERDNYLQAVAEKYFIGIENLRKLVAGYAAQTGLVKPAERPKPGTRQKNSPEEGGKRAQRMLLTWITDEPAVYDKVRKYISAEDFTEDLYRKVADRLFRELDEGIFRPAGIISAFEDEEEQRQAAELFNTSLPRLDTGQEREKAFHDILLSVKKNSYAYYTSRLGSDVNALNQAIEGKKALEELAKTHISLE